MSDRLSAEALDHIQPVPADSCRWCNGLPVHDYREGRPVALCADHLRRYKRVQRAAGPMLELSADAVDYPPRRRGAVK